MICCMYMGSRYAVMNESNTIYLLNETYQHQKMQKAGTTNNIIIHTMTILCELKAN